MTEHKQETYNSFQKLIGELSMQDFLAQKGKKKKLKSYSLSANTEYIIECRNQFMSGELTEEEAKTIILKQKLIGKAI